MEQAARNIPKTNSLLRFYDVGPEYVQAGVAGLATDSEGAVYMVGGLGLPPDIKGFLRKFDANGRLLWTVEPEGTMTHFRQVVVDNSNELYVISESTDGLVKPRLYKFTQEADLLWTIEIDAPFGAPELELLFGQTLRIVPHDAGVLVATYFLGRRDTEQESHPFTAGSVINFSPDGLVIWRTNFWPTVDWLEPRPSADNDIWISSEIGVRVRGLIPDGSGGAYVVGDRRLSFGDDGFYFHLSDQGRALSGAVSLRASIQESGLIEESWFRELGFEPVWIAEGNSGVLYISGAWNPLWNSSALLAITADGIPVWLSGRPCTEEDLWQLQCGFQQHLHPKVLPDGTIVVLEQGQKPDNGNKIKLIHYSSEGEVLSSRVLADTMYGYNVGVRGLLIDENMIWISGNYSIAEFADGYPVGVEEYRSYLLRCPSATLRSGGDCPVRIDD